jgi:hypothetical protein
VKKESLDPNPFFTSVKILFVCNKTQCIFCISNQRYSYKKRTRSFRRVFHIINHVKNVYLKYLVTDKNFICYYFVCKSKDMVFNNVNYFKNHVQVIYGITLWELRFVD